MNLTMRFLSKNINKSRIKAKSQTTDYQSILTKTFSIRFRIHTSIKLIFFITNNI